MTNRERVHAIMNYQPYDRMPVVSFGFWDETVWKWKEEGHISAKAAEEGGEYREVNRLAGFDFNWQPERGVKGGLLYPPFDPVTLKEYPDGKKEILNGEGNIIQIRPNVSSIPTEIGHTLVDRQSWEKYYVPRLSYGPEVLDQILLKKLKEENGKRNDPLGLNCGSMLGYIRNWLGFENTIYLWYEDPDLFADMVKVVGDLIYRQTKYLLESGVEFDYAHFWEDICGNDGPLLPLDLLDELAGPYYKKITDLLKRYGINIVSLDCDGRIDAMIPIWLKNGVNTMFPIEIGSWNANIGDFRRRFGKELLGVGGVNKMIFGQDYSAVDKELERLKPLIALGGYIPCPDHRIPPDAKWEVVQYYCEQMKRISEGI